MIGEILFLFPIRPFYLHHRSRLLSDPCACVQEQALVWSATMAQSYRNIPRIYQIFVTEPDARLCELVRDCEAVSSQKLLEKH